MPWFVVAGWLAAVAFSFWFFEFRFQRSFDTAGVKIFETDAGARAAEFWFKSIDGARGGPRSAATVVHVYRAQCTCNRFTEPHLKKIEDQYRTRGVRFIRVERSQAAATGSPTWIDATPAALVFDAGGKLVYFGPYSDSAWCGSGAGLVERVLEQTLRGNPPHPQTTFSRGCFCPWIETVTRG